MHRNGSKNSLFARPNLKFFALGAVMMVIVNDLFTGISIRASARALPVVETTMDGTASELDLNRLLQHAIKHPSQDAFYQLSHYHQRLGNYEKARAYLLRAEELGEE